MTQKKKRIVIALGGNALGNTLPEQMQAVKTTAKAIVDLIQEGCEVIVSHGNGPQVGMINHAMAALSREDVNQPNTPLSVCVAMSQPTSATICRMLYVKKCTIVTFLTSLSPPWSPRSASIPKTRPLKGDQTHRPLHDQRAGRTRSQRIRLYRQKKMPAAAGAASSPLRSREKSLKSEP